MLQCPPPLPPPFHPAPHISITHLTYLLKLSRPHVGEALQTSCWGHDVPGSYGGNLNMAILPCLLVDGDKMVAVRQTALFCCLTRSAVLQKLLNAAGCFCRAFEIPVRQQSKAGCPCVMWQSPRSGYHVLGGTEWQLLLAHRNAAWEQSGPFCCPNEMSAQHCRIFWKL